MLATATLSRRAGGVAWERGPVGASSDKEERLGVEDPEPVRSLTDSILRWDGSGVALPGKRGALLRMRTGAAHLVCDLAM